MYCIPNYKCQPKIFTSNLVVYCKTLVINVVFSFYTPTNETHYHFTMGFSLCSLFCYSQSTKSIMQLILKTNARRENPHEFPRLANFAYTLFPYSSSGVQMHRVYTRMGERCIQSIEPRLLFSQWSVMVVKLMSGQC